VLLFDSVQRALAVGDDGEVYVTTRGGALAIRDGTVSAQLTPAEGSGDTVAEPFAPEGRVGDIGVDLAGPANPGPGSRPGRQPVPGGPNPQGGRPRWVPVDR
jgi:hypothetical protein